MRVRSVIGLALVFASIATALPAHAERKSKGRDKWRGASNQIWRTQRAFERATRDALQKLDSALPEREWEPSPEPEPSDEPVAPARPVAPEPIAEAPAAEEPVAIAPGSEFSAPTEAQVAIPTFETAFGWLRAIQAGAAVALAALAAAFVLTRRRDPRKSVAVATEPAPPIALPVDAATRVRTAVDAAVAAADVAAAPFPGGGRYEILEEIGRGGMGVVYKARDKRLDRVVALKRLPDTLESDSRYVELLLREARSTARLNHPNIVIVHDVDRENGGWFITMELLEGRSLAATLKQHSRIGARSVVWLGEQIVAGLGYAHERGIVHRDVKPGNLLVTNERTLKLMDFGVAKILEEARRKRTLIGGTPAYMAPEQAAGEVVDGRTDLYALGATFFELLTGKVPFASGDPFQHHRETDAPDPREHGANVPAALAELVRELMRKRPEERPASAQEVAARLRAIARALPARSVA